MKISYSELSLLGKDVLSNVDMLISHGAANIELMMDGKSWEDHGSRWTQYISELRKRPVRYSVHPPAWDINLTCENKALRDTALEIHKNCIVFANAIDAKQVVLHPGFITSPAFCRETAQQRALEAAHILCAYANPFGIQLAFENVGYKGTSIYSEEEYATALEGFEGNIGYLIDIGHAHINGWNTPALIRRLKKRLYALHIHDNNADGDQHLPIGEGTVNWEEIFKAIAEINGDCELILEYAPFIPCEKLKEGQELLRARGLG